MKPEIAPAQKPGDPITPLRVVREIEHASNHFEPGRPNEVRPLPGPPAERTGKNALRLLGLASIILLSVLLCITSSTTSLHSAGSKSDKSQQSQSIRPTSSPLPLRRTKKPAQKSRTKQPAATGFRSTRNFFIRSAEFAEKQDHESLSELIEYSQSASPTLTGKWEISCLRERPEGVPLYVSGTQQLSRLPQCALVAEH